MSATFEKPTRAPEKEARADESAACSKAADTFNAFDFHERQVGPRSIFLQFLASHGDDLSYGSGDVDSAYANLASEVEEAIHCEVAYDKSPGELPHFGRGLRPSNAVFKSEDKFVAFASRVFPERPEMIEAARQLWASYRKWRAGHA